MDVNVFVMPSRAKEVFAALPKSIAVSTAEVDAAEREGQVRVWWEDTPIDLFLDVHSFHDEVSNGVRWVSFSGRTIPVLGCTALTIFKALFDRTKDWADIEAMIERGAVDIPEALGWLGRMVGSENPVVARLESLAS
ncbi:MAG TPA: hypothetical protein VLJ42_09215 [Solirubrobacteraceae bacterium]|nr:hypothetical protein [Solirubrobacteraceae bacterium]